MTSIGESFDILIVFITGLITYFINILGVHNAKIDLFSMIIKMVEINQKKSESFVKQRLPNYAITPFCKRSIQPCPHKVSYSEAVVELMNPIFHRAL